LAVPERIRLFKPNIRPEAGEAASAVLREGWFGLGPRTARFEEQFAEVVGARHCVAVSSGTAALHLALHVLDLPNEAEVVTTPLTWVATHHAISHARCVPVPADIQPHTGNIDPAAIERCIGPRTGALLVIHYAGYPCDMDEIRLLAAERGLPLIEDCAHALGSSYRGSPIGGADSLQCFSFNPVKNLTTGQGGAITTNSGEHVERLRALRSLGLGRPTHERLSEGGSPYRTSMELSEVGFPYAMSDLNAAIGLAQLPALEEDNARRAEIARMYADGLRGVPGLELLSHAGDRESSHHMSPLLAERRDALAERLLEAGIESGVHYPKNPLLEHDEELPGMEQFSARTLTLPHHPLLADADVERVIETVRGGWQG